MQRIETSWRELVALVGQVQDAGGLWVGGNTYEHYAEHVDWINQLISESSAAR
jgi:hypothetical protein